MVKEDLNNRKEGWNQYQLIDSGSFQKLERFGNHTLIRAEPKAIWERSLSQEEWLKRAHFIFEDEKRGWQELKAAPKRWEIGYSSGALDFKLQLKRSSFKHVGLFPEQMSNWHFIYSQCRRVGERRRERGEEPPKILNLFAYTGAASLAAKAAGANIYHLDSIRGAVDWARQNMELSGMRGIRWIVEDAFKFVKREVRRGNRYQGIILDPPPYGLGPNGERWRLESLIFPFLKELASILEKRDSFLLLNIYTNGYTPILVETLLREGIGAKQSEIESGELTLIDRAGRVLPLSIYGRVVR